jgi:hypothetical protein
LGRSTQIQKHQIAYIAVSSFTLLIWAYLVCFILPSLESWLSFVIYVNGAFDKFMNTEDLHLFYLFLFFLSTTDLHWHSPLTGLLLRALLLYNQYLLQIHLEHSRQCLKCQLVELELHLQFNMESLHCL